jgi:NAD(P)H-dependent flavin oxidoreductase YrpB (nitropropane dioxygenase family)
MIETSYTQLTGCSVPVQQAPMGPVASPELAVAVADAGGVGTITALGFPAKDLDALLSDMASKTKGVLAANFLTANVDRDALAAAAQRVRVIDFFSSRSPTPAARSSPGRPAPLMRRRPPRPRAATSSSCRGTRRAVTSAGTPPSCRC